MLAFWGKYSLTTLVYIVKTKVYALVLKLFIGGISFDNLVTKNVNPTATVTISHQVDLGSCEPGI